MPESNLHSPETVIILRYERVGPEIIDNLDSFIKICGENERVIKGETILSTARKTIVYNPHLPFEPGERIFVSLKQPGTTASSFPDTSYYFDIAVETELPDRLDPNQDMSHFMQWNPGGQTMGRDPRVYNGVSVPSDFPEFKILINETPDNSSIFLTTINDAGAYAVILDNQANPLFYWYNPTELMSFKAQPDNRLSLLL